MDYVPELGQMAFGQPWRELECPGDVLSALTSLRGVWDALWGCDSNPFANTGNRYTGTVFSAHAYSWNEEENQEFNFAWRDVRVSWYKHLNRGTSINRAMSKVEIAEMLRECTMELLSR